MAGKSQRIFAFTCVLGPWPAFCFASSNQKENYKMENRNGLLGIMLLLNRVRMCIPILSIISGRTDTLISLQCAQTWTCLIKDPFALFILLRHSVLGLCSTKHQQLQWLKVLKKAKMGCLCLLGSLWCRKCTVALCQCKQLHLCLHTIT